MYLVPQHADIHYRCAMDIVDDRSMGKIRNILWKWLNNKVNGETPRNNPDFPNFSDKVDTSNPLFSKSGSRGWFFKGRYSDNDEKYKFIKKCKTLKWAQIRTALVGDNESPLLWGMELIHPDNDVEGLYWATTVSLEYDAEKESVRFVATIRKYLRDYYIGRSFETPRPSTPRFVSAIINKLTCKYLDINIYRGIYFCTDHYKNTDVPRICNELVNPQRKLPYVLLIQSEVSDEVKEFTNGLRKLTHGNANVFVLSRAAYDELIFYSEDENLSLPHFENEGGALVLCSLPSYGGHYLKTYDNITEQTLQEIVCAVSRYSKGEPRDLVSFQSVVTRQKILEHSRLSKENEDLRGENELFVQDNQALSQKEKTLKGERDLYKDFYDDAVQDINELKDSKKQLEHNFGVLQQSKQELSDKYKNVQKANEQVIKLIGTYLTSLDSQLKLCGEIFSDRIIIHSKAIKSAEDYDKEFPSNGADFYEKTWRMLQEIVTTLYDCYTAEDPKNIERLFNEKRQFSEVSFTMNEGKQTNRNSSLSRFREIDYGGKKVSIAPHLKLGSDNKALRLHIYYDNEKKKIVVGYWGKHIPTAASKKGGERR